MTESKAEHVQNRNCSSCKNNPLCLSFVDTTALLWSVSTTCWGEIWTCLPARLYSQTVWHNILFTYFIWNVHKEGMSCCPVCWNLHKEMHLRFCWRVIHRTIHLSGKVFVTIRIVTVLHFLNNYCIFLSYRKDICFILFMEHFNFSDLC